MSFVQGFPSLHGLGPATHTPPEQTSGPVQGFPSLHEAVLFVWTQPSAASQRSSVHGLLSLQLAAVQQAVTVTSSIATPARFTELSGARFQWSWTAGLFAYASAFAVTTPHPAVSLIVVAGDPTESVIVASSHWKSTFEFVGPGSRMST
jgi:hypothetical protein